MSHGANERKPLLNFSETQERASLIDTDFEEDSMARKRKGRKDKKIKLQRLSKAAAWELPLCFC